MKIIITETQYKSLKESLLLEASDDVFTYTTKNNQKLYRWDKRYDGMNYLVWQNVPAGTKFKFFDDEFLNDYIQAWNGALRFDCSTELFYARGYEFKDKVLTKALKNKFCNGKNYKGELVKASWDKRIEKDLSKVQDQTCINRLKSPYQKAINWWKNKLNEPAFYSKLKKLNSYTDQQTKEWIKKYKDYLYNNVSGPFCPKQTSNYWKENFSDKPVMAHLAGYVNTNRVVFNIEYQNSDLKDLEGTLVHEIQHALYELKPMTPNENWKKVFPYKVWVEYENENKNSITPTPQQKSIISKYGIKQDMLDWWYVQLKSQKDPSQRKDTSYDCRITELASRVVNIKFLLGYSTSQKITVNDFKKFIEYEEFPYDDSDVYFLVLCWINNGMEDIKTFLDNLDKYVVAKAEPNKGDDIKNQVS